MRTRVTRGSAPRGTAEKKESTRGFAKKTRSEKPFGKRGEKPFGEKSFRSSEKPFGARSEKPFAKRGDKPFGEKPFGGRDGKPFSSRGDKPYGNRSEKPYGNRSEKPYGNRSEKPYGNRSEKPFGNRSEKPFSAKGDKPFGRGEKSFGGKKPFAARDEKPFRKRAPKVVNEDFDSDTISSISGDVRLNKFIANSGVCSRREADEYILAGLVTVNGEVVTELGTKVNIDDDVRFNGERLKGEKKVYIMLNKPKDFVTTTSDPHAEKNVMDLISKDLCPQRIFPVGRLDKSTTGILLLTNDGNLTEMLTHPSYGKKKIYEVTLDKNVKQPDFEALLEGFELEDGFIAADAAAYGAEKNIVGVEIHSGKNRIVRRMFEHLGYNVKKLDRVYFAGLTKKNLKRGQWRFLTDAEVGMLKSKGNE